MKTSKHINKNDELMNKSLENTINEPLEPSTLFNNVVSNPKSYGSNDMNELKIDLKNIRNKISEYTSKLEIIDYDFMEVVDKADLELLAEKFNSKKIIFDKIQNDLFTMNQDFNKLKEFHVKTLNECSKLKQRLNKTKRSSTPRPDWDKYAHLVDGGFSRWHSLSMNKSSDQLVRILLNEFLGNENLKLESKTSQSSLLEEFENDGKSFNNSDEVSFPQDNFLVINNYESPKINIDQLKVVLNRRLNRTELIQCLEELWNAKIEADYKNMHLGQKHRNKMSNFVFNYFESKFKSKDLAFEWTVNLKEACSRFKFNEDAKFMLHVLNEDLDEETYHCFYSILGILFYSFGDKLKENYSMSVNEFRSQLESYFPYKQADKIDELIGLVKNESLSKDHIDFLKLINNSSSFLSLIKEQFDQEQLDYINRILNFLDKDSPKTIHSNGFKNAVLTVDPLASDLKLKRYCKWIFGSEANSLINFNQFVKRLTAGNFHYH